MLQEASGLIGEIARAIEQNASRAREAFGFAAEANQKANTGVNVSRLALEKMKNVFERVEQSGREGLRARSQDRPGASDPRDHHRRGPAHEPALAQRLHRGGARGRGRAAASPWWPTRSASWPRARVAAVRRSRSWCTRSRPTPRKVADEMRDVRPVVINEGRDDVNTIASSLEHIASAVGEASERAEEIFLKADTQARDAARMVSSMDEISQGRRRATSRPWTKSRPPRVEQLDAMEELVRSTQGVTALSEELRERAPAKLRDRRRSGGGAP